MRITEQELIALFKDTGALLTGHFKLSSGRHSGQYLQCALVLQHPTYAARLGAAIAENFRSNKITCVAGPALGGVVIAHEVARALNVRCIFGERENGRMTLRRGFTLSPQDKVLVVEDVITTGGSIKELIGVIKGAGARIAGVAAVIDRSPGNIDPGCGMRSLTQLDIETFSPETCPLCKKGVPVTKPGSRN